MTVYHGSGRPVEKPDILHSRREVDFGAGFYAAPLKGRAAAWGGRFRRASGEGAVSVYTLDERAFEERRAPRFAEYSEDWLDFVAICRKGQDHSDWEIVVGDVANDRVFDTVELYLQNLITKTEAIGRLKFEEPNLQICLRSQDVLDKYVKFEGSFPV